MPKKFIGVWTATSIDFGEGREKFLHHAKFNVGKRVVVQDLEVESTEFPKGTKQRTNQQNRALYLHFTNISKELQNKGITQRGFYEKAKYFDMPCTKEFIHDMWLMVQKKMYKTDSTTLLHKQGQIDEINDVLMKGLGETCDIEYMQFPNDPQRQHEKNSYQPYNP